MIDPFARAKELSSEGMTYAEIATTFDREEVQWEGKARSWSREQVENLVSHGSPKGSPAHLVDEDAPDDSAVSPAGAAIAEAHDEGATEPALLVRTATEAGTDRDARSAHSQALPGSAPDLPPKKKWHDRKWLLVTVVSIVAVLLGLGIAVPDRQAAKDEGKTILADARSDASEVKADAKSDASGIRSDARDEADEIVADAQKEREKLLGGVKKEKAGLLNSVDSAKGALAKVSGSLRTAKANLASTERTRAQKQQQVNSLNREIRSSTSLSRENAVETAGNYLDSSSFSCQGLIEQLQYEDYSASDATYAAKEVGLC